jgi:hypothetical protein
LLINSRYKRHDNWENEKYHDIAKIARNSQNSKSIGTDYFLKESLNLIFRKQYSFKKTMLMPTRLCDLVI